MHPREHQPANVRPDPAERDEAEACDFVLEQDGTIDGRLVRVGAGGPTVPVTLAVPGQPTTECSAEGRVAQQLAERLSEYVRLHGTGRWRRDGTGAWTLLDFRAQSFTVLHDAPPSTVLAELRDAGARFEPGAYEELHVIRHGPPGSDDPIG